MFRFALVPHLVPSALNRAAMLILVLPLAACVGNGDPGPLESGIQEQPAQAQYDCGDGETLSVAVSNGVLDVTDSHGDSARLAAAPPGQTSRYDADGFALALEGNEALWMKAGEEPMACRR